MQRWLVLCIWTFVAAVAAPGCDEAQDGALAGTHANDTATSDASAMPSGNGNTGPADDAQSSTASDTEGEARRGAGDDASPADTTGGRDNPDARRQQYNCINDQDDAAFKAMQGTYYQETINECAVGCFLVQECMVDCLSETLGFTEPCSNCWVGSMLCAMDSCFTDCPGEFCSPCMESAGCWVAFELCAGTTPDASQN